jgi:hypothetical protein
MTSIRGFSARRRARSWTRQARAFAFALAFVSPVSLMTCDALAQTGDVFSSGSGGANARGAASGSGGNTTRRTGKQ